MILQRQAGYTLSGHNQLSKYYAYIGQLQGQSIYWSRHLAMVMVFRYLYARMMLLEYSFFEQGALFKGQGGLSVFE